MKRRKIITRPIQANEISFDELYDAISARWEERAERLQARRWRKLKARE